MNEKLLQSIVKKTIDYHDSAIESSIGVTLSPDELKSSIDTQLPEIGEKPEVAIDILAKGVEQGLINNISSRYFGFVIGGATETSIAADWLTSAWDQCAHVYKTSPAAALIEEVVVDWVLDLLDLPRTSGVGLVTGAQMANFTALSVARNTVLQHVGWDVDKNGLQGAPQIYVVVGACCHGTILSAIQMMGLGTKNIKTVDADDQGQIEVGALEKVLQTCDGPTIICAQAGNVNTGAFDPFLEIVQLSKKHQAWLHVDGAFGLWARVSPKYQHLTQGVEEADSWATDAHKWLNVPQDSGIVIIRDAEAHRQLKTTRCAYAGPADLGFRDGTEWVPENSRRARGFVLYAALRNLGRQGIQNIVENGCAMAKLFAAQLSQLPHAHILNDVVLNQVLCRLEPESVRDLDAFNEAVAARIQQEGVCWIGTTIWQGQTMLRISVSNYGTSEEDVNWSVQSIKNEVKYIVQKYHGWLI